jgi:arylsulfatase A-like enzyme
VCDEPVVSTDFYPTMIEMAGISRPTGNPVDGVSLTSLLRQTGRPRRDAIYWHYPHYSNQGGKPGGAIRRGDYKLIEFYEDQRVELYHIREDAGEKNDLAARMPDRVKDLRRRLENWRRQMKAVMPAANPQYNPAREWEGIAWKQKCV